MPPSRPVDLSASVAPALMPLCASVREGSSTAQARTHPSNPGAGPAACACPVEGGMLAKQAAEQSARQQTRAGAQHRAGWTRHSTVHSAELMSFDTRDPPQKRAQKSPGLATNLATKSHKGAGWELPAAAGVCCIQIFVHTARRAPTQHPSLTTHPSCTALFRRGTAPLAPPSQRARRCGSFPH